MGKLSHTLIDNDFFSALGTMEISHLTRKPAMVSRGVEFRFDKNNGVIVVYDEAARPWIRHTSKDALEIVEKLRKEFDLIQGIYVPHSNDGGHFIRIVVPILMGRDPRNETP